MKKELYFQNPKQTPQLRRVDSAYGDLSVINIAAANSGAQKVACLRQNSFLLL
jgi:hypothetical protein